MSIEYPARLSDDEALKVLIQNVRRYMQDYTSKNKLLGDVENTDLDIALAMEMTISDYNMSGPLSIQVQTWTKFPSLQLLIYGCTRELLMSQSILSARNSLQFQDSGGVTVNDQDQYQKYPAFIQILETKYEKLKHSIKLGISEAAGNGYVGSEYDLVNSLSIIYRANI
jgi:hypothetical protein